ncbi:MAG: orotidine-5'-phosphate decarboxylase [Desulfitobacteriaceae bacterium]
MNNSNAKIMVALDVGTREKAMFLADALKGSGCWLKVGLELYLSEGPPIIQALKNLGFPIFLDLKLHDIPTTVERAVRAVTLLGLDMLNVHCSGGYEMMARATEAARGVGNKTGQTPKIIGVTVLTSLSEGILQGELGVAAKLEEHVLALARLAKRAGLDGVVASAQEAPLLRQALGPEFLLVTPGIRPTWSEKNDQVRVLTPKEAMAAGSSYLVVGRPVTGAENPREALQRIWD